VEVPTTLLYQGNQYSVIYRLEEAEGWRITDVVVEGVSFVANYRAQFDAQFKRGGSDAVIDALSESVVRPQ
jgi:phospholipid transport system substrate-binding protein